MTYRCASGDRHLDIEHNDPRGEHSDEGNKVSGWTQYVADSQVDRVHRRQEQRHIRARRRPWHVVPLLVDLCIARQQKLGRQGSEVNARFTIAVSSPGSTRSRSPTCTTPLETRPDTPMPDPVPL